MRPESLFFLFSPVTRIKGVGGATAKALERLLPVATAQAERSVPIVRDLLFHLPVSLVDRSFSPSLRDVPPEGAVVTLVVNVDEHFPPKAMRRGGRRPYKVVCSNDTGDITLVFFNAREDYIAQALPVGKQRVVSGRTEYFDYRLQMTHPDVIAPVDQLEKVKKPEPVYPLTLGLTSRRIGKMVEGALEKLPVLPEWILPQTVSAQKWPAFKEALDAAHHPQADEDFLPTSHPRARLAYDEMLANQLHLAMLRAKMHRQPGTKIEGTGKLTSALKESLPFTLTAGQERVLKEISGDMASGHRMARLLQGDVGSGKTVVALFAILKAVEQGLQAALMVPTELIAGQHYDTIRRMLDGLGVEVALLTGSVKGKQREKILSRIASGEINIVIGTHALFQEHVEFKHLALAVIDEQHRFGVAQRMALLAKGDAPHVLHMTATPIPRSLTMMLYGDMECSLLTEKPAERQPITTRAIPLSRYDEVMERLKAALDRGEKAYWICPMIDEKYIEGELELTPEQDIAAAELRHKEFKARFGDIVGLVHGRMKPAARHEQMQKFTEGDTRLLVATTVVEVGVDVRDATIMVIEKAERFGLAQLHQLRGRVGRGDKASACVLLYTEETAKADMHTGQPSPTAHRLSVLRDTDDGFKIAEADLGLRGGGDLLGTRQSGLPRFVFMKLWAHQGLLTQARDDAAAFLKTDPDLAGERGQALRLLLQLFEYE
jgi:ATP-dependent DNA helicase RecG